MERVCQVKQRTEWRQKHNKDNECESHLSDFGEEVEKTSYKKLPKNMKEKEVSDFTSE